MQFNIQVTWSIGSFTLFSLLYFLFNMLIWKFSWFGKILKFPNLTGQWACQGASENLKSRSQYDWTGTITIVQTWDKILISLKTTSRSKSLIGGIRYVPGVGYEVSYHYENTPPVDAIELKKHEGFCVLTFANDLKSAEGWYFNNIKDRASYGVMNLERGLRDG